MMIDPRSVDRIHYEHQCRYNQLAEKLERVTKERDQLREALRYADDYTAWPAHVGKLVRAALKALEES